MKWILRIFLSLILLVIVSLTVIFGFIVPPQMLTPRVVEIAQHYTKSEISIKSVDLSIVSRFPNITLKIDSLQITQLKDSIADLVVAKSCRIAVDPFALMQKKVVINHFALQGASIYMYVDEEHSPIEHFELGDTTSVETVDSLSFSEQYKDYTVELKRFKIDSAQIIIDDRIKQFYTRVTDFNVDLALQFSTRKSDLEVDLGIGNLLVWREGEVLVKKTSLKVKSDMEYDSDSLRLTFNKALLKVNKIGLKADGTLQADTANKCLLIDINSSLRTPSLAEFMALATDNLIDDKEKITTSGSVHLDTKITGKYSDSVLPDLDMKLKIQDGMAKYDSKKLGLEQLNCEADLFVNLNTPQNSYANIHSLHVNSSGVVDLTMSGTVKNLIEDPDLDVQVQSDIDFDRLMEVFPLKNGVAISGQNTSDLKAKFKLSDIQNQDYAKLYLNGESKFTDVNVNIDGREFMNDSTATGYFFLEAENGSLLFGDKVLEGNDSRTLLANIDLSGVGFKDREGKFLMAENLQLSAGANFDRGSSKMNGIGIQAVAQNTNLGIDSLLQSKLDSSDITLTISPKNETRNTKIFAKINSSQITAEEYANNSDLRLSSVDMDLTMLKKEEKQWDMDGQVSFSNLKLFTDLFPLRIGIVETKVSVENNRITLDNAKLSLGQSKITASGYIENLIRRMFLQQRARVAGELTINSPLLNITEIMDATNKSVLLSEASELSDSLAVSDVLTASSQGVLVADSMLIASGGEPLIDTLSQLFLVPRGVDFVFDMNVDAVLFEDATIEQLKGRASIKQSSLTLSDLSLMAIGAKATGNMTYSNVGRDSAKVDMTMNFRDVNINRIGELSESINTMFPIMQSLEGVVDFDFRARTSLYGDSEVDVSSLRSAMSFKGKDLVLMDSETFASLSKTLMFKNKDKNLIDSLEVLAIVDQSKVDVLPFEITMDRYIAIVGGTQDVNPETFDVDYAYNISILKSPLPFKAGVDITGNLEDFDFKITKAKLKGTDFDEQRKIYTDYYDAINALNELDEQKARERVRERMKREEEQRELESANMQIDSLVVDSISVDITSADSVSVNVASADSVNMEVVGANIVSVNEASEADEKSVL